MVEVLWGVLSISLPQGIYGEPRWRAQSAVATTDMRTQSAPILPTPPLARSGVEPQK